MASKLFESILNDSVRKRFKGGEVEVRDWFRDKAVRTRQSAAKRSLAKDVNTTIVPNARIGRLTMFTYDAKHKATLPYWDMFPVIFPIKYYKDGFLGINLHYLPPIFRARLMDSLYDLLNNDRYNDTTKLSISYKILAGAAKHKYFRPCIKRYLRSHVKSDLMEVGVAEWDYVAFLPLAKFQKARQKSVWDDSVKLIMERSD